MQQLIIEGIHNKSPEVNFDAGNGNLELKGTSCMENARAFYSDLILWVNEYASAPQVLTQMNIRLKYFNTSSAKCILELLEKAKSANRSGKKLNIAWYYHQGDEDMIEAAEIFSELLDFPIKIVRE